MTADLVILCVASVTFFIGGLSKGAIGFGLPMIAIPMLTATGSLPLALSIAVPPVVATNLWQIWKFRAHHHIPFMRSFLITGLLGLLFGTFVLKNVENAYFEILLGCLVLFYLFKKNKSGKTLTPERQNRLAPIIGSAAGLVHGTMGMSGLVGTPFFYAAGLSRPSFIFANSLMFIVFSALHMPALAVAGLYQPTALVIGLFVMIPAFAGLWIGNMLVDRLKASTFPLLVKGMLMIAAILPIWNGLAHFLSPPT
ncbi:sulfite exporter TauE/SafE family protein [Shimia sp.]|uniref:sulfite exporter TauE/SafE family protein n=1 Tax=Shimia sp. TaxID=1954381 RepID=UPI0032976BD4